MKFKFISVFLLFAISLSLYGQRRTNIVATSLGSGDGAFSIFNSDSHFVIHNVLKQKDNVNSHGLMIVNPKDNSTKVVPIQGVDKTSPFFFSPYFTRMGFGFFEAFDNKQENNIDVYFHEVNIKDYSTTKSLIYSIKGGKRKNMLFYHVENTRANLGVLYFVNIGDEKQKASATLALLDKMNQVVQTQEVEFNGYIVADFSNYVAISEMGRFVSFHQVKNDKGIVSSELTVIKPKAKEASRPAGTPTRETTPTNPRESRPTGSNPREPNTNNTNNREISAVQKFIFTSDDLEILTSHKIYVDEKDMVHFYGTIRKKKDLKKSMLQYKLYGISRNDIIITEENEIEINDKIKAHSLLTLSQNYTFYIIEEGNFDVNHSGMTILGGTKTNNKFKVNPNDDPETKRKKEEEIRRLKEEGAYDINGVVDFNSNAKNSIHIFCLDKTKKVLWSDLIKRNNNYTAAELSEMDNAQFEYYFWAVDNKLICLYNKDIVKSITQPVISSGGDADKNQQTTTIRTYSVLTKRFNERNFEASEKSEFKYIILPGLSKINAFQSLITIIKTDKGVYHPMTMMI